MKNRIKLNEGYLKNVIKESIKKVLKEDIDFKKLFGSYYDRGGCDDLFDKIDSLLKKYGKARVSRFYSNKESIVIISNIKFNPKIINRVMEHFGYEMKEEHEIDGNVMRTFQPSTLKMEMTY